MIATNTLALPASGPPPDVPLQSLRLIDRIVPGMGIVPVTDDTGAPLLRAGEVAVYDEDVIHREGVFEGLWCIEYQRPRAWSPHPETRRVITRYVVRIARGTRDKDRDLWWVHPLGQDRKDRMFGMPVFRCSDGPWEKYDLADKLLGPIVGIYQPSSIRSSH